MNDLVDKLFNTGDLSDEELKTLLESDSFNEPLAHAADIRRRENYGDKVYIRGLIEFTNYCRNNCYYCGIRRDNKKAERYRLIKEEILLCCDEGYRLGFRTFVMQGGEDPYYTDEMICDIISEIKRRYLDGYDHADDNSGWFGKIREITADLGYAVKPKDFKKNPDMYKGSITDVSNVIRVALTGRCNSPDLWEICHIIGEDAMRRRIEAIH